MTLDEGTRKQLEHAARHEARVRAMPCGRTVKTYANTGDYSRMIPAHSRLKEGR